MTTVTFTNGTPCICDESLGIEPELIETQRDWLPIYLDLLAIGGWVAVAVVALLSR